MRRTIRFFISFLLLEIGIIALNATNNKNHNSLKGFGVALANTPTEEDPLPPPDPIKDAPIPQDTIIYGPNGIPIFIIEG